MMKIVVLAGGTSTERDISIVTGSKVCEALVQNGHNARMVDVFMGIEDKDYADFFEKEQDIEKEAEILKGFTKDIPKIIELRNRGNKSFFGPNVIKLCRNADIVFMGLHGSNGEDGKIQATFDLLGVKYTGSGYLGSALAMDKSLSKELFISEGVPCAKGIKLNKNNRETYREVIPFPLVVKPCCGGSSVGVSIAHDSKEFKEALNEAFKYEDDILIEEYIKGREFSVGVIEGKALPVIEIAPVEGFYDYTNKYLPGKTKDTCPADVSSEITKKIQDAAEAAYKALKLESYARIDVLMDEKDNVYCLEANTLPGMTPTSLLPQEALAIGKDFNDLCEELIEVSLRKYL